LIRPRNLKLWRSKCIAEKARIIVTIRFTLGYKRFLNGFHIEETVCFYFNFFKTVFFFFFFLIKKKKKKKKGLFSKFGSVKYLIIGYEIYIYIYISSSNLRYILLVINSCNHLNCHLKDEESLL